jgi:LPS sulfotransferase NodH
LLIPLEESIAQISIEFPDVQKDFKQIQDNAKNKLPVALQQSGTLRQRVSCIRNELRQTGIGSTSSVNGVHPESESYWDK